MKQIIKLLFIWSISLALTACASTSNKNSTGEKKKMTISSNNWKAKLNGNPISSNIFCADPTAVEYEGRLYVYGTNDHEQYEKAEKNTYEKIKSLVCFSTDDMVNWTYHGKINTGKITPWIYNSWAPSVCKRVEEDGLTHFYIYFSNSGTGVGVITATSPLGPWTDPLKKPLIKAGMKGLDSPDPFDPGVCIDENGIGWLSFGGGVVKNHTRTMPGSSKLVKLGSDLLSIDSDFINLQAPHFFEASEMNYINGTYVYTYNTDWEKRDDWPLKGTIPASQCSMTYMTSKTPLISDSWQYQKHYFKNPGEMGFDYSNNHTHYEKYMGKWYLFYHTMDLQNKAGTNGGFRSIAVDKIEIDEENVVINMATATRKGPSAIKNLNPYETVPATTMVTSAEMWYENDENPLEIACQAVNDGGWILVKNVDFGEGATSVTMNVKGTDSFELRLADSLTKPVATIYPADTNNYKELTAEFNEKITGIHDVYILFCTKGNCLKDWKVNK